MISLWRIFCLEVTSLVRSWTTLILLIASLGWMFAAKFLLVTDSTEDGAREMLIRYGLGGVFALLVVSVLSIATGSIATEREAKRLQLTRVRPVSPFAIAWGKFLALAAVAAAVLVLPCALLVCSSEFCDLRCSHVYRPKMESPAEEAAKMYDFYMADPETPPQVKMARKSVVLRILEQRARDNYQTVRTNETAVWTFPGLHAWTVLNAGVELSVRLRFSNDFDMRDDVRGALVAEGLVGVVSNITKTAIIVPLRRTEADIGAEVDTLSFSNDGKATVMLRPRQDIELLVPADSFAWNMLRAYVVMVAVLAFVAAFGVFLGAGLSRPVALFTAIVLLAVCEMSPSVVEQYPDQLETDRIDSIGLAMTRLVERCTKSVSSLSPLSSLADGDCVERRDAAETFALDFLVLPAVLCLLSGFLIRRKQEP